MHLFIGDDFLFEIAMVNSLKFYNVFLGINCYRQVLKLLKQFKKIE